VPQFVDIEDKIIGPLTLKQFLVYVVGVLLLIPVFLRSDLSLFLTIAIPVLGVSALFAHFRWHGKTLFAVMTNIIQFYFRGSLFVWRRTANQKGIKLGKEIQRDWQEEEWLNESRKSGLEAWRAQVETEGNVVGEDVDDPLEQEEKRG